MPRSAASTGKSVVAEGAGEPAGRPNGCQLSELFSMLGQSHMLTILHALEEAQSRPLRFGELQVRLRLSPKTLSDRLRTLVETGFVARHAYHEIPPRVEYLATRKTVALHEIFVTLDRWARENTLTEVPMIASVGRTRR